MKCAIFRMRMTPGKTLRSRGSPCCFSVFPLLLLPMSLAALAGGNTTAEEEQEEEVVVVVVYDDEGTISSSSHQLLMTFVRDAKC